MKKPCCMPWWQRWGQAESRRIQWWWNIDKYGGIMSDSVRFCQIGVIFDHWEVGSWRSFRTFHQRSELSTSHIHFLWWVCWSVSLWCHAEPRIPPSKAPAADGSLLVMGSPEVSRWDRWDMVRYVNLNGCSVSMKDSSELVSPGANFWGQLLMRLCISSALQTWWWGCIMAVKSRGSRWGNHSAIPS
jgi:hypothetical protein